MSTRRAPWKKEHRRLGRQCSRGRRKRHTQGNRHKKQRVSPRPDRKRGREYAVAGGVGDAPPRGDAAQEESTGARRVGGTRPSDAALNRTNRQRLDALSRRYPGKLELRAPDGATPIHTPADAGASRLAARLQYPCTDQSFGL